MSAKSHISLNLSINSLVDFYMMVYILFKKFLKDGAMIDYAGETFGQWLRRLRKEKGLTQESLAVAAGNICTGAYISSLEREQEIGKSGRPIRPDVSIVEALAAALDAPVSIARKKAGYDPGLSERPAPDRSEITRLPEELAELNRIFLSLSPAQRKDILTMVRALYTAHSGGIEIVDDVDLTESDAREVKKGEG